MDLILVLYRVCVSIYIIRTLIFLYGAYKIRNASPKINKDFRPFVSVIIPARDEEDNIRECIESLAASSYPLDLTEVIAVNDRSTDNTQTILDDLSKKFSFLNIVNISDYDFSNNLRGKPGALQHGIDIAKGDIILMTDADCTVTAKWIETVVSRYADDDLALAGSFTNIKAVSLFDKIQAVEWIYMHTLAAAGFGTNLILGCFGNNLSVRKTDFDKIGGYRNIKFSVTEDLALLKNISKIGKKRTYICSPDSLATTKPCTGIKEYLNQKKRWAVGGLDLGLNAVIFVLSSFAMWTGIVVSLMNSHYDIFAAILGIRLLSDYLLTVQSVKKLKLKNIRRWVFPATFLFMLMELIVPFMVINKTIVWKDQTFTGK